MVFEPELNCSIRPLKSGVRVHSGRSLRRGPGTQTLTRSLLALAQGPPADKCSLAPLGAQNKKPPPRGGRGAVLKSSLPRGAPGPGTQTLTPGPLALAQGPAADECSLAPLRVQNKKRPARGGRGAVL